MDITNIFSGLLLGVFFMCFCSAFFDKKDNRMSMLWGGLFSLMIIVMAIENIGA